MSTNDGWRVRTIEVTRGRDSSTYTTNHRASVYMGLIGVHKDEADRWHLWPWHVTHVRSGTSLASYPTREMAKQMVEGMMDVLLASGMHRDELSFDLGQRFEDFRQKWGEQLRDSLRGFAK